MGNAKIKPVGLFLPTQKKWRDDDSLKKLMEKGRQTGISWTTAARHVMRTSVAGTRYDAWVSSRDILQAQLFLGDCKAWLKPLKVVADDRGEVIIEKGEKAFQLEFANGRSIYSLSSNPDAQAGKRGDRTLDEFALNKDAEQLYSIAVHGVRWGGQLQIFSTHRGTDNFFNRLVREVKEGGNPKGFSYYRYTLEDALNEGLLYKLQKRWAPDDPRQELDEAGYFAACRAECADEESFLEECQCVPSNDDAAFITHQMISGCEYREGEPWEYSLEQLAACPNELYVGLDIGRTHDRTVCWVLEKSGGIFFTRAFVVLEKMSKPEQEKILWPIFALPRVRRVCIDKTGLGIGWCDDAQARFGTYRIEGVTFSGPVKEAMAYPVRHALEDKTLRIPYDKYIRSDLRAIRKTVTTAGNIRFEGERNKDGHSDRFWALALAMQAADGSKSHSAISAISRRDARSNSRRV